jgi:hypothetical protein
MEQEMGFTSHVDPDDPTLRLVRRTFEFKPNRSPVLESVVNE